MRKYLQPNATMGAGAEAEAFGPMRAALITSRPVLRRRRSASGPDAATHWRAGLMRLRQPELHGVPAYLIDDKDWRRYRRRSR